MEVEVNEAEEAEPPQKKSAAEALLIE